MSGYFGIMYGYTDLNLSRLTFITVRWGTPHCEYILATISNNQQSLRGSHGQVYAGSYR